MCARASPASYQCSLAQRKSRQVTRTKKANTQGERYAEALDEAEQKEASNLSLEEIEAKILDYFDIFYNFDKNEIDIDLLAMAVKRKLKLLNSFHQISQVKF